LSSEKCKGIDRKRNNTENAMLIFQFFTFFLKKQKKVSQKTKKIEEKFKKEYDKRSSRPLSNASLEYFIYNVIQ